MATILISNEEFDEIFQKLTPHQQNILKKFHEGKSDEEIAQIIKTTENTVRQHLRNIADRFGIIKDNKRTYYRPDLLRLCNKYL